MLKVPLQQMGAKKSPDRGTEEISDGSFQWSYGSHCSRHLLEEIVEKSLKHLKI
jgi:hypothetical protein